MNIFVQYVQQNVRLRVRIIPVGYLVEKLGMAFRDVGVIPLPALYKSQISKTEIGKRFQVILDICPGGQITSMSMDRRWADFPSMSINAVPPLKTKGQPAPTNISSSDNARITFFDQVLCHCNATRMRPARSILS